MSDTVLAPDGAIDPGQRRAGRSTLFAFVTDAASEAALREGLADMVPQGLELRRATLRQAIATLQKMPTPRVLVVDISGEQQPISALVDLSEVVEPDVRVLVIGDREDTNFYRQVTRGLGVLEYLYKPLTRGMVARHFAPWVGPGRPMTETVLGGRVISVMGCRGGAGATTISANLAWHFAEDVRRHTLLLDCDLHMGDAALLLGAKTGNGLRVALETPQRVDELFVERSAQPAAERLFVMASEERLAERPTVTAEAVEHLLATARRRYNFIIVDTPFHADAASRAFVDQSHQRIVVVEPSLSGVRDALRLIALPGGPFQARRPILVLNRVGRPGSLTRRQVEDALGTRIDVAIAYMPRQAGHASSTGTPLVTQRTGFRTAMLELAREAAFTRLAEDEPPAARARAPGWLGRLLEKRR